MKRTQTTFTFSNHDNAIKFEKWLKKNAHDSDYGRPIHVDTRPVGSERVRGWVRWCVEYITSKPDFICGLATGIDLGD